MRTTSILSSSCCRRWTRPERTAPSSTSCRGSIRRAARSSASRNPRTRSSTTTFYGGTCGRCRSAAGSVSSIARTTRTCSSCACTRKSSITASCHRENGTAFLGGTLRRHQWFERHLERNGTLVLKFFLHLSKKEQKRRFLERLDNPDKNWKFSDADLKERDYWDEYQEAFQDMLRNTRYGLGALVGDSRRSQMGDARAGVGGDPRRIEDTGPEAPGHFGRAAADAGRRPAPVGGQRQSGEVTSWADLRNRSRKPRDGIKELGNWES